MKRKVKSLFKNNPGRQFKRKAIAKRLEIQEEYEYSALKAVLYNLEKEEFIKKIGKRYILNLESNPIFVDGILQVNKSGYGFVVVNNSKAIESEQSKKIHNYANLKSQCWIKLADYVNEGMIGCAEDTELEIKELLIQDLEQIKLKDFDKEGPLRVISKKEIKDIIQRSTDIGDAVMMRMIFELKPVWKAYIA